MFMYWRILCCMLTTLMIFIVSCRDEPRLRVSDYTLSEVRASKAVPTVSHMQDAHSRPSEAVDLHRRSQGALEKLSYWRDLNQQEKAFLRENLRRLMELIEPSYHATFERAYLTHLARLPGNSARRSMLIPHLSLTWDVSLPRTLELTADLMLAAQRHGGTRCSSQVKVTLLAGGRLDDHHEFLKTYTDLIPRVCPLFKSLDGPSQLLTSSLMSYSREEHPWVHRWIKAELKTLTHLGRADARERLLDRLIYLATYAVPAVRAHLHTPKFEEHLEERWHALLSLIGDGELLLEQAMLTHPGLWRFITRQGEWFELLSFADVFALEVFEGKHSKVGDLKRHLTPLTRRSNIGLDLITRYMRLSNHPEFIYRSSHEWIDHDPELFNHIVRWLTTCIPGHERSCSCDETELRRCLADISPSSRLTLTGLRRRIKPPERVPVIGALVELGQRGSDGREVSIELVLEGAIEVVDLVPNPLGQAAKLIKTAGKSAASVVLKRGAKRAGRHALKGALMSSVRALAARSRDSTKRAFTAGVSALRAYISKDKILSSTLRRSFSTSPGGQLLVALQALHGHLVEVKRAAAELSEAVSLNNMIIQLAKATNTATRLSPSLRSGVLSFHYHGEVKPVANLLTFLAHNEGALRYLDDQVKGGLTDSLRESAREAATDLMGVSTSRSAQEASQGPHESAFESSYLILKLIYKVHAAERSAQ